MLIIKTLREKLNLSQADLAEKSGLSARTIFSYEKENSKITINNLKKIANALNEDWIQMLKMEYKPEDQSTRLFSLVNEPTDKYSNKDKLSESFKSFVQESVFKEISYIKEQLDFIKIKLGENILDVDELYDHLKLEKEVKS